MLGSPFLPLLHFHRQHRIPGMNPEVEVSIRELPGLLAGFQKYNVAFLWGQFQSVRSAEVGMIDGDGNDIRGWLAEERGVGLELHPVVSDTDLLCHGTRTAFHELACEDQR